ncbi:MAG TPA: radical SAM protein [Longimicrobiales bacterium]|nr:radical SAM protein [Longimicrobiales bacterium]
MAGYYDASPRLARKGRMRIAFVRPNLRATRSSDAMTPLSFAVLRSLTPSDVEAVLYDERLEEVPLDESADLVAITVETYTARRAYQIAATYRRVGIPVVMGGYHPTFLPHEALEHADAVVRGDAEGIWPRVVEDARRGFMKGIYEQAEFPALGGLPPDHGIFAGKRYAPISLVQYGRGCRYACDFCSIRAFYGSSLRQRPVREVVEEIERLQHKHVFIVDDNIFVDVERAKELFRALTPLGIRWSCQVSIDITRDPELVALMQESGCISALVGFESLEPRNLKQMAKGWNLKYDYRTAIDVLHDHGIMIYGTFVFGYDHDTVESFDATVEFAVENKLMLANFNPLTPTPGARLYDRLEREGRLIYDRWWLDPGFRYGHATYHPRGMTADELTEGCYRARTSFNTARSTAKRLLDRRTHLRDFRRFGLYLLSNRISKREIHAKQGQILGAPA